MRLFISGDLLQWIQVCEWNGCWARLQQQDWNEVWSKGYPWVTRLLLPTHVLGDESEISKWMSRLPQVVQDTLAIGVLMEWLEYEKAWPLH